MRFNKLNLIIAFLIIASFFLFDNLSQASDLSPDAIAVRVLPNAKHYSVLTWYQRNDFKGSPQNLTVDGYDAVRDGRTVYVNAANLDDNGNFYTNIYVISYNQQAENQTMDIFGQMLSHWKFNAGLNTAQITKESLINDTRRLADLSYLNELLERYKLKHGGSYPDLKSGSYVAGASTSKWPSWQGELGKLLGATLPLDPLNSFGDCTDYDKDTCWNAQTKNFKYAFNTNKTADNSISKTNVYWYKDGVFHVNLEKDNLLCGNGELDEDRGEECDGSAGVPEHYTCTSSCTKEYVPYCGDSLINQPNEECDSSAESCTTQNGYSGMKQCNANCVYNQCVRAQSCGDGQKNGPEQCDNGLSNTNTACAAPYGGSCNYCDVSCQSHEVTGVYCGDSVKNGLEQCDDGASNTNTACAAPYGGSCVYCDTACLSHNVSGGSCGDGIIQPSSGEICDGSTGLAPGERCASNCQAKMRDEYCTTKPTGTIWSTGDGAANDDSRSILQTFAGNTWYPDNTSSFNETTSKVNCYYRCPAGTNWSGSACVAPAAPPAAACDTGNSPVNNGTLCQASYGSNSIPNSGQMYLFERAKNSVDVRRAIYKCQNGLWSQIEDKYINPSSVSYSGTCLNINNNSMLWVTMFGDKCFVCP